MNVDFFVDTYPYHGISLTSCWERFQQLLTSCNQLFLLQARLLQSDVFFFPISWILPHRIKVKCMKFVKLVVIHPLRWTTDFDMFLLDTVNYYLTHWNSVTKKSDNHSWCFVRTQPFARWFFEQSDTSLQRAENHLHGLWVSNKEMPPVLTKPLQRPPNTTAFDADVLFCLSSALASGWRPLYFVRAYLFMNCLTLCRWTPVHGSATIKLNQGASTPMDYARRSFS
jgi:hypothetical protein